MRISLLTDAPKHNLALMKKYKTGGYRELIQEVEITKETDKSVWVIRGFMTQKVGSQARKRSESTNFFDTWDEAYDYIYREAVEDAMNKVKASDNAKNYLEKIRDMKFNRESK